MGHPDAVIRKVASQVQADLIVLGTHGLGGFRKWLLGSTTEQVLRATRTPVLAVPLADAGQPDEHAVQSLQVKRILAATDFSVPANCALRCASDLARATGASMLMAHVVTPVVTLPQWRSYVGDLNEENASRARTARTARAWPVHERPIRRRVRLRNRGRRRTTRGRACRDRPPTRRAAHRARNRR